MEYWKDGKLEEWKFGRIKSSLLAGRVETIENQQCYE
jgi:hypothetical protein